MRLKLYLCCLSMLLSHCLFAQSEVDAEKAVLKFIAQQQTEGAIQWQDYQLADSVTDSQKLWLEGRITAFKKAHYLPERGVQVLASKYLSDLAMVIVEVTDPVDPYYYGLIPVALCADGNAWKVAPLVGSYRYTGIKDYLGSEVPQRESLESWAVRYIQKEMPREVTQRHQQANLKLSHYKEKYLSLEKVDRQQAALFFMQMCQKRDLLGVLACLEVGDEEARRSVTAAFRRRQKIGVWGELLDHNYIYGVLEQLGEQKTLVNVGVCTSDSLDAVKILEFKVEKVSKAHCWAVKLPKMLLLKEKGELGFPKFSKYQLVEANRKRLGKVADLLLAQIEPKGAASLEAFQKELVESLLSAEMLGFFSLLEMDKEDGEVVQRSRAFWSRMTSQSHLDAKVVYVEKDEDSALLGVLSYAKTRPSRYRLSALCAKKSQQGWLLQPYYGVEELQTGAVVSEKWLEAFQKDDGGSPSAVGRHILPHMVNASDFLEVSSVEVAEVKEFFECYQSALTARDFKLASKHLAAPPEASYAMLAAMGHELHQHMGKKSAFRCVEVLAELEMFGVIVAEEFQGDEATEYRLYPIVRLQQGLRVMPQAVFMYPHARGQKLLNEEVDQQLAAHYAEDFVAQRNSLIVQFNKRVESLTNDERK